MLEKSNFSNVVCRELNIVTDKKPDLSEWEEMLSRINNRTKKCTIALCGKYVALHDAYLSVAEALRHGGYENSADVEIKWVDCELLTKYKVDELLGDVDGILVPGGFGNRGIEGKIMAAKYAREHDIPYLGICLGMQTAVIEYARDVLAMLTPTAVSLHRRASIMLLTLCLNRKALRIWAAQCVLVHIRVLSTRFAYG